MTQVFAIFLGLVGVFILGILLAFPTMWCWNYLITEYLFPGVKALDLTHAWVLNILAGILFKSSTTTSSK